MAHRHRREILVAAIVLSALLAILLSAERASGNHDLCSVQAAMMPAGATGDDGTPLTPRDPWLQIFGQCPKAYETVDITMPGDRDLREYYAHTPQPCSADLRHVACAGKPDGRLCFYLRTEPNPQRRDTFGVHMTFPDGSTEDAAPALGDEAPPCALKSNEDADKDLAVSAVLGTGREVVRNGHRIMNVDIVVRNVGKKIAGDGMTLVVPHSVAIRLYGRSCSEEGFPCKFGALPPGAYWRYQVTLDLPESDARRLRAHLSPTGQDSNPLNDIIDFEFDLFKSTAEFRQVSAALMRGITLGRGADHVDVAAVRTGSGDKAFSDAVHCAWLTASGKLAPEKEVKGHSCDAPNWLRAKGTKNWSFKPKRKLPPGHYVLYARATSEKAVSGVALSKKNKNRVELTVR